MVNVSTPSVYVIGQVVVTIVIISIIIIWAYFSDISTNTKVHEALNLHRLSRSFV